MTTAAAQAPWAQTASGQVWDLLDPRPGAVHWRDIAYQLGQIPRFGGAARPMVSVAQHSMLVAVLVPKHLVLHALLHDAHEAILGDWTTPVKQALAALGDMHGFHELERRTAWAIHRAAGIEFPLRGDDAAALKHADLVALATEKRECMAPSPRPVPDLPAPDHFEFDALSPTTATGLWLARLRDAGVSQRTKEA